MKTAEQIKETIEQDGFDIIENIFSEKEINSILDIISKADSSNDTFRKTKDLFAIRQFFKEVPEALPIVFNKKLLRFISTIFSKDYFVVKSIYFDKPAESNWFVAYHQDLTISVDNKTEADGYSGWTIKQHQFSVQPPIKILQDNFTIRIHLDDTDENNGALKVIRQSHLKEIYRAETIDWKNEEEKICCVKKGGIMIMKPLLMHASNRTTSNNRRRVIHIEFSKCHLPEKLNWSEYSMLNFDA